MSMKPTIRLIAVGDPEELKDVWNSAESLTLRQVLERAPARSLDPIDPAWMDLPPDHFIPKYMESSGGLPVYDPPGLDLSLEANGRRASEPDASSAGPAKAEGTSADGFPDSIAEADAVRMAYAPDIEQAASFLRSGLSVLVYCDKLVVQHLWKEMTRRAHLEAKLLEVPGEEDGGLMPRGLRQRQLAVLRSMIRALKKGDILVIPHLDLLAGGDSSLPTESRELIELVYELSDRLMLAFADRSLPIHEVLAARFAVRQEITGVRRTVTLPDGTEKPLGRALVTAGEAARFTRFDPEGLYKNVSGMNPVRIRHALQYAVQEEASGHPVDPIVLYRAIRVFKAKTSANFEVPDVSFDQIGGYEGVKAELWRALRLMTGSYRLPDERLRQELIPRGFIFHGLPGTGKTLFAKAVANQMNATIQVVSGPEVTDMYVGESERKVRELFAEARRNAPAVLVFDEFDSIATQRSGRDDGGSRAGNALVAQILTEMDGFRPDVPMLVIGTTNRLDIIDEALLRPSRFKAVAIPLPNREERRAIAVVHSAHFKVDVSPALLDLIAGATEGMSGDDVRSLFRDACVGMHCEDPPRPPDARRLGELVGLLRKSKQQQDASKAERRHSAMETRRNPQDAVGPTGVPVWVTPEQDAPTQGAPEE